jgi:hypothetical protein
MHDRVKTIHGTLEYVINEQSITVLKRFFRMKLSCLQFHAQAIGETNDIVHNT